MENEKNKEIKPVLHYGKKVYSFYPNALNFQVLPKTKVSECRYDDIDELEAERRK